MARITLSALRTLQIAFPSYVTDDDSDLSEYELLRAICDRQADDLRGARLTLAEVLAGVRLAMGKLAAMIGEH